MQKMKDLLPGDRPQEKCLQSGPAALTDAELLAVILRCGTRERNVVETAGLILKKAGIHGGLTGLYHLSIQELREIDGIGTVKAVQLKCIAELARRMAKEKPPEKLKFTDPAQIAAYFMEDMRHLETEELRMVMFDTKNQYLKDQVLFRGTVNSAVISAREIFIEALKNQAVFLVLLHNHPSGDPEPSAEDIKATRIVAEAGNQVGITLIDHIIIGNQSYCSLRERGIIHG